MSQRLTMTLTFDSCTDDSHCYNDNHDGTERRELIGRSCSGHEELGMCLDGWNAVSSQTTHSTTVPDTILVAGPFSVKTMFTPLLVQQWQGVTWMTQCERLPDWCDTAAWRGDKTRVCHEATLPKISTGNFLSNASVTVWPDTCNVLWGGYKVKESQTGVTLRAIGTNPLREGVSLTRQPCQLFQSATCHHGMQIMLDLVTYGLVSGPSTNKDFTSCFLLTVGPKFQTNPFPPHTPPKVPLSMYPLNISQLHLCNVLPIHPFLL